MVNGRRLFGTDGIRGTANTDPMTAETALRLGQAAGIMFVRGSHRHQVLIGKDTRLSGYMIEPALVAGFVGVGMDVHLVGPLPTPAIAMLTRSMRADLGVMISASHNPFEDNGIKLFGPDGYKLSDTTEAEIEALMAEDLTQRMAAPAALGRASRLVDAAGRYIEGAKATFPRGQTLDGLKIVIDCAHGAAYKVAPTVLWELGATVIPLGVTPDGFNINKECGSTVPEHLCRAVVEHGADLGLALDGDADRLLMSDERGRLVDGDQILALAAMNLQRSGRLRGGAVAATVMSNLGLERYLEGQGLALRRTAVGDRYVMERMRADGLNLGGEQSGHIILSDYSTTGDGLVAALQVLAVLVEQKRPASDALRLFDPLPQRLRSVRFSGPSPPRPQPRQGCRGRGGGEPRQHRPAAAARKRDGAGGARDGGGGGRGAGVPGGRLAVRNDWAGYGGTGRMIPRILVIGGSDSGGGAGIQADIKTAMALGAHASTAVTAVTAQDTHNVHAIHPIPPAMIRAQIELALQDPGADAVKTGMLGDAGTVEAVADLLAAAGLPVVVDPVMVATGGARLLDSAALAALKRSLLPVTTVLTPNIPEAEVLTGLPIPDRAAMEEAAETLLTLGVPAVLLKGGHGPGDTLVDLLATPEGLHVFEHPRLPTRHTHGTGCTLATALAVGLATGLALPEAVRRACDYVQAAIAAAPGIGSGHGPLGHLVTVPSSTAG